MWYTISYTILLVSMIKVFLFDNKAKKNSIFGHLTPPYMVILKFDPKGYNLMAFYRSCFIRLVTFLAVWSKPEKLFSSLFIKVIFFTFKTNIRNHGNGNFFEKMATSVFEILSPQASKRCIIQSSNMKLFTEWHKTQDY